jgi:hypothetical protein
MYVLDGAGPYHALTITEKGNPMRNALLLLSATFVAWSVSSDTANAAGRRRVNSPRVQAVNKQAALGAYGRAVYPKYYWGIPAREFQNAGTPHGDIGIRGDGIQWQPW